EIHRWRWIPAFAGMTTSERENELLKFCDTLAERGNELLGFCDTLDKAGSVRWLTAISRLLIVAGCISLLLTVVGQAGYCIAHIKKRLRY
ncbi:hypothetical protein, partial [Endozoicomonas sp. ALB122]|uniref:hypothetical protein n=1 Tax=Endozoicomonas sp. ALB122 TaxID=3403075 RepID=UPI003BB6D36D